MAAHLTVGPHCVDRSLEGGLAPRKMDKGGMAGAHFSSSLRDSKES